VGWVAAGGLTTGGFTTGGFTTGGFTTGGFTTGGFTTGGFTTGGFTTGGFTTGGFTTGGFTTGGFTTGGFTTGGFTVAVDPPPIPTEVEPRLMGAVMGMISWVPERMPSLPVVVLPGVVPAGAVEPVVPEFVAEESPSTPAEVEPRLIGAVMGMISCVPERMPSLPEVVLPGVVPAGVVVPVEPVVPELVAEESPSTPAEVEPRLIGAVIGATTCVPERMPSLPVVVLPGVVPAGAVEPLVPEFVAEESPSTPAEVEPRLIGAVIGATTCVPERTPSEPEVEAPGVAGAEVAGAAVPAEAAVPDVADESPPTPTAVAPMLTGTDIGATT